MSKSVNLNKIDFDNKHEKCAGKNCYKTEAEAKQIALTQELLNWNQDLELKTYQCHICGKYHLTRVSSNL